MRSIDADALVDELKSLQSQVSSASDIEIQEYIDRINRQPTIEAAHAPLGRWECTYDEGTGETDVTCSHCKDTRTINGCYVTTTGESCYYEDNYCPNCGAKMDLEE